jgi:hypothetical protein
MRLAYKPQVNQKRCHLCQTGRIVQRITLIGQLLIWIHFKFSLLDLNPKGVNVFLFNDSIYQLPMKKD